mmetsp:Transcript_16272/g.32726  ORF Transcript_16272/g.32726 Transcript_16272/m.32726 type:complete len:775 (+) Transcript_16272:172-2496(+)
MAGRDPYPMQSEEARRLEESVAAAGSHDDDGGAGADGSGGSSGGSLTWNRMGLRSSAAPSGISGSGGRGTGGDAAASGLMGKKKGARSKRRGKGVTTTTASAEEGSIYDDLDDDAEDPTQRYSSSDYNYENSEIDFLDQSLTERHSPFSKWYRRHIPAPIRQSLTTLHRTLHNLLLKLHTNLYGTTLPPREMVRTLCLAMTLFFLIGGYWLLRSLKDPVLTALCGVSAIPKAKMLSVFVVLLVVGIYNRMLDTSLPKHQLFYLFGTFYFLLFTVIAILLSHPKLGLPNQTPNLNRILGWISYCSIESFGSVMVSLFWSFANSNFDIETAKASYGLLVATAQVGSILGPTVVSVYGGMWGVPVVYFGGALCMVMVMVSMFVYVGIYGSVELRDKEAAGGGGAVGGSGGGGSGSKKKKKKEKAGILEGLYLFAKYNYVKGIFAISCLFMVEVTIVDYTMKVLARDHYAAEHPCHRGQSCWDVATDQPVGLSTEATAAFTTFMGLFGQATNTLSFLMSLLGTAAVIRTLGLRLTLLLFPSLCLGVIIMVRLHPTLYVVFAAMIILKANSYALNNPTKEMLYQPTAPNVKYKAKSWIDIFGARGSKALGSVVTNAFSDSAPHLIQNGSLVGMAVATFLIFNARFMGRKFDEYMDSGYVVGGDNEEDGDGYDGGSGGGEYEGVKTGVEMASVQNDVDGSTTTTSCALPEDDTELGDEINDGSPEELSDDDDDDDGDGAATATTATAASTTTEKPKGGAGRTKKKRRGKRQHGIAAIEQV